VAEDWVERVGRLRQWSARGVRAPHKPLLVLYALGCFQRDAQGELPYSAVESDLKRLLSEYGPAHPTTPAYPFHHLVSDGVWEVRTDDGTRSPGPRVGELRARNARGRLAPALRAALTADPSLAGRMARRLLDDNFPPSLHGELCGTAGLDLDDGGPGAGLPAAAVRARRARDRRMREVVLAAYEYRCAFCGYDGALAGAPVGLEAAHVRWWAYGGPDEGDNGLCLCSLHHRLFDKGVLGVAEGHRINVSDHFTGRGTAARAQVLDLAGRALLGPQAGRAPVADGHRAWHAREVFRGRPRAAATV
jgi:putative restriction endonuclease